MEFLLYFATAPAPKKLAPERLERMLPVRFSSEEDALHGAALVLRGGQHPWLIAGPGVRLEAHEIAERCAAVLKIVRR
jgi:hypothetical protein